MNCPVMACQRCDVVPTTAAPPPAVRRRRDQSTSFRPGCIVRPLKSVFTPVNTVGLAAFSVATKASMSRGFGTSQLSPPTEK